MKATSTFTSNRQDGEMKQVKIWSTKEQLLDPELTMDNSNQEHSRLDCVTAPVSDGACGSESIEQWVAMQISWLLTYMQGLKNGYRLTI